MQLDQFRTTHQAAVAPATEHARVLIAAPSPASRRPERDSVRNPGRHAPPHYFNPNFSIKPSK